MWRHPWLADIIANLISSPNRELTITNLDLELAALVLHEVSLLAAVPEARMAAPRSGSDNTPTVSWSTKEASTINLVVADLLYIRALHSRQLFLYPSVFITRASRIAWQMTPLACLNFITLPFSSTRPLSIPCHKVRKRSPSRRQICFPA